MAPGGAAPSRSVNLCLANVWSYTPQSEYWAISPNCRFTAIRPLSACDGQGQPATPRASSFNAEQELSLESHRREIFRRVS